jgi:hypothetical protein
MLINPVNGERADPRPREGFADGSDLVDRDLGRPALSPAGILAFEEGNQIGSVLWPIGHFLKPDQVFQADKTDFLLAIFRCFFMLPNADEAAAFNGREDVYPNWLKAQLDNIPLFAKVGG